uniref:Glutaredoxin domain-containing protein n=1 Tax=Lotharella globosa TaxID=91324 RepID=A0A7S3YVT2_9EUKA
MAARHEWALAACGLLVFLGINTAYTPPLSSSVVRLHRDVPHRRPLSQAPRYLRMRVSAASGMAPVQIVTTEGCKFCRKTKETFKSRGIEYEELSVAGDPMLLQKLAAVTGIKTVPQVFVDGRFVGDSETTLSILEEKSTQGLLSAGIDAKSLPTDTLDALREAHATYTTQTKMYDDVEPGTLKALYVQLEKALMTPDEPRPTLSPDMVRDALESLSEFQAQDASSSDIVRDLIANNWLGVVPGSDGKLLVLARSPPKPRRKGDPFNQEFEWSGDADHPGQISEQLQRGFTYLLDRHGKDGGRAVDYKALGEDPAFGEVFRQL